jgi:hypothetical protein
MRHPLPLAKRFSATYFSLRVVIAVLAFLLPPLLRYGGLKLGVPYEPSMSAYYWASRDVPAPPCEIKTTTSDTDKETVLVDIPGGAMRNTFVGFLFAVGVLLYCYKGYSIEENLALNFAGLMAWGIASFPMDWTCSDDKFNAHGTCAILFFAAITYVSLFRSRDTLTNITSTSKRQIYSAVYIFLSIAMIAFPVAAWIINVHTKTGRAIYWEELTGIYAFSAYWVVKIFESRSIAADTTLSVTRTKRASS